MILIALQMLKTNLSFFYALCISGNSSVQGTLYITKTAEEPRSFLREREHICLICVLKFIWSFLRLKFLENFLQIQYISGESREKVWQTLELYPKLWLVICCCWDLMSLESQSVCSLFARAWLRSIIFKHVLLCSLEPFKSLPKVSCSVHQVRL